MSVINVLTKEHELFRKLVDRMERALNMEERQAREQLRSSLLILLPALDKHEEIEDLVFEAPAYAHTPEARVLLNEIGAEHRKIESLHEDLVEALRSDQFPFPMLKSLIQQLIQKLRIHFASEEARLWPHYLKATSRSLDNSIEHRAQRELKALERKVRENASAVSHYIGEQR